jgi:hypothetical protein
VNAKSKRNERAVEGEVSRGRQESEWAPLLWADCARRNQRSVIATDMPEAPRDDLAIQPYEAGPELVGVSKSFTQLAFPIRSLLLNNHV